MDLLGILRIKDSNGNWVSVPGLKGDTGEPFKILGIYATAAALEAAVTDPGVGDVYLVGTTGAYDIYLYLADGWHNTGRYMPKGDQGDPAPQSAITSAVETWLAANVDPETGYVLDRTLSQSNAAAPADLVGDFLNEATETIENIGYVTNNNGREYSAGVNVTRKSNYQLNVYGTASGWAKFDVLRGNWSSTSGTPTLTANLNPGTYTLRKNDVLTVMVGTDFSSSVTWADGATKTFENDVCVWLRVTSSSRNYGTSESPSVFEFAIYEGDVDLPILPNYYITAIDKDARKSIESIQENIETADFITIVNADTNVNKPYNLIPPDCTFEPNKYVNGSDGTILDSATGKVASGYIEIDPSQEYLCHILKVRIFGVDGITNGSIPIDDDVKQYFAFYDKDKNYIPYTGTDSSAVSKIIPANARYFRFTLNAVNVVPYAMLVYGNYSVAPAFAYTHYRHDIKQVQTYAATGLENLKMVMFGDSITHGDLGLGNEGLSYINYANNYLRSNIINCGLGGSRMSQGVPTGVGLGSFASLCENIVSDDADAWDALDAYITPTDSVNHDWMPHVETLKAMDWNTVQAIGILYGANDWANNVALGTEYNENPLTYDGACAYGLKKLLTKYPHLQVIIFTPFYREITDKTADQGNSNGDTLFDYGKSLESNVRPVIHCPVVDSGNEVGMNRYNITLYAPDGTHPRANLGQYRLGRYFAESIKRYVQPF